VKAPGFGGRRKARLEDIGILTGGKPIMEETGIKLEGVRLEDLGRAKCVTVDKDNTTPIIDGAGVQKNIEGRIKQLRAQIEKTTADYDREKLQERLAKLAGVAIIRVGAATETEMKEKKARVEGPMRTAPQSRKARAGRRRCATAGVDRVTEAEARGRRASWREHCKAPLRGAPSADRAKLRHRRRYRGGTGPDS
jgi:hypothetical protein